MPPLICTQWGSRVVTPATCRSRKLSDALALSAVHVNRVLMEMRHNQLISLRNQQLTLHDYQALRSIAGFDVRYLHLEAINARSSAAADQRSA